MWNTLAFTWLLCPRGEHKGSLVLVTGVRSTFYEHLPSCSVNHDSRTVLYCKYNSIKMFSLKRLHLSIYIHIYPHKPKQFRRQTARPLFVITETERLMYEL